MALQNRGWAVQFERFRAEHKFLATVPVLDTCAFGSNPGLYLAASSSFACWAWSRHGWRAENRRLISRREATS
jgi:hypothetical protein